MSPTDATADAVSTPVPDVGDGTCSSRGEGHTARTDHGDTGDRTTAQGAEWSTRREETEDSTTREAHRSADHEDTLDLRLPDELIALIETGRADSGVGTGDTDTDTDTGTQQGRAHGQGQGQHSRHIGVEPSASLRPDAYDLLDGVAEWGPITTPAGVFQLVPVRVERDLALICHWMNDPAVAAFWELAGPQNVTEEHLRSQLDDDGRSVPCLGVLNGTPMSYWEIYRADLDPLARHYPARPHDTGIHLLVGTVADRGRGLGSTLLRAVADLVLDRRPACARVVAEPDLRNIPSVTAFLSAGFRFSAEVDLPAKRAALVIRDRSLRDLM
ncbi:GNAT family N-acetyltransferase [Streptomyces sp. NRRL B-24085]|uniref:GNAT family N-acetyltransferase n=1 Tax=Streptomyces sp. NRRL B-24085 TaxID=1709476 RepID=UPI0006B3A7CF|nr:GNAT family N-acetyltransferase [Streptomyces sp. NRRL B-24085]